MGRESAPEPFQRLEIDLAQPVGEMNYKGQPALYALNSDTEQDGTNERSPAIWKYTSAIGSDKRTISVWIWEGTEPRFKEILLFHELEEATLILNEEKTEEEAHRIATERHLEYARKILTSEDLEKFMKWHESVNLHGQS